MLLDFDDDWWKICLNRDKHVIDEDEDEDEDDEDVEDVDVDEEVDVDGGVLLVCWTDDDFRETLGDDDFDDERKWLRSEYFDFLRCFRVSLGLRWTSVVDNWSSIFNNKTDWSKITGK